MEPLISVIIPVYNNSHLLSDCLDSVLGQNYSQIEIIVADDYSCSFDETYWCEYIRKRKKNNIINYSVYQNVTNFGTVKNLNIAIKKSSGKIIKIIAADDTLYDSSTLSVAIEKMMMFPNLCFVGDVMLCDETLKEKSMLTNKFINRMENITPNKQFSIMSIRNYINASGVIFKRDFFEVYGFFDENYRLLEDWPTWLKVLQSDDKIKYLNCIVAKRRVTTGVVSNNNPIYLNDRRKTWDLIVKKKFRRIGLLNYVIAFFVSRVFTIPFFRKIAYLFCKKR